MLQIFHGDNTALSRKLLQDAIAKERQLGRQIQTLEGDKLTPRDLDSTLATANLFSQETLVIENLLSRLRSKDKDACLELLAKYSGDKNVLLWDKKEVTKANLSKLPSVRVSLSKAPTALFSLLESLGPGSAKRSLALLHEVVASTEDIVVFTMIARQISSLIIIRSATSPKFSPWQLAKLRSQAANWSDKQLTTFLSRLLQIDFAIKTGATKLSYTDHLDLLLTTLLR